MVPFDATKKEGQQDDANEGRRRRGKLNLSIFSSSSFSRLPKLPGGLLKGCLPSTLFSTSRTSRLEPEEGLNLNGCEPSNALFSDEGSNAEARKGWARSTSMSDSERVCRFSAGEGEKAGKGEANATEAETKAKRTSEAFIFRAEGVGGC